MYSGEPVGRYLPFMPIPMHFSASPGYMLTKLTKTILEHDQDLKVQICLFMRGAFTESVIENMGEFDSDG